MKNLTKKILQKAREIKVIGMDVDGVLTAGELIILDSNEEVKIWNIKDRFAYTILRKSGLPIKLAWITGRESNQVKVRGEELKIDYVFQGCVDKQQYFNEIVKGGYKPEEIAYIGDDWMDISILKRAGLAICPKNAPQEVKKAVDYISRYDGGKGVFREVVEIILKAQNAYEKTFNIYDI